VRRACGCVQGRGGHAAAQSAHRRRNNSLWSGFPSHGAPCIAATDVEQTASGASSWWMDIIVLTRGSACTVVLMVLGNKRRRVGTARWLCFSRLAVQQTPPPAAHSASYRRRGEERRVHHRIESQRDEAKKHRTALRAPRSLRNGTANAPWGCLQLQGLHHDLRNAGQGRLTRGRA
jgi:hypothetical protein